jgi:hypothetical protein
MKDIESRLDGTTLVVRIPMPLPATRRTQADRCAGRERACAKLEAADGRHAGEGAGARTSLAAGAGER